MALVIQIGLPYIGRKLAAKQGRIKRRGTDKRQYLAAVDIQCNGCAGLVAKGLFSLFLDGGINCQLDTVAHGRVGF